jgi:hypothetical protein
MSVEQIARVGEPAQVLQNLVNLLGIPSSLNFAVMGTVILIGVLADQQLVRVRQARAEGKSARDSAAREVTMGGTPSVERRLFAEAQR